MIIVYEIIELASRVAMGKRKEISAKRPALLQDLSMFFILAALGNYIYYPSYGIGPIHAASRPAQNLDSFNVRKRNLIKVRGPVTRSIHWSAVNKRKYLIR